MNSNSKSHPESAMERAKLIQRQWAVYAFQRVKLLYPELSLNLYEEAWCFTIHIDNCEDDFFKTLSKTFDERIRIAGSNTILSQNIPKEGKLFNYDNNYSADIWLSGEPLSRNDVNDLISFAVPNVPAGSIDYDTSNHRWIFKTPVQLSTKQINTLKDAALKIGVEGELIIQITTPDPIKSLPNIPGLPPNLNLTTLRRYQGNVAISKLLEKDEDNWRNFLDQRSEHAVLENDLRKQTIFSCFYEPDNCGESRLCELLTIYDQVNIQPSTISLDWLATHKLSLTDLQELVQMKRVRLILPHSVNRYAPSLIESVTEVDPDALVLSRTLAAKTITQGQKKDPLLYAPLTYLQRAELLSILHQTIDESAYKPLIQSYSKLFLSQHDLFMMRGALANIGCGIGAHFGNVFRNLLETNIPELEFMICGAGVEWAMALGSSYIPRVFKDYDETNISYVIASVLGRTNLPHANPVTNRIHNITNGLLAVTDVPPIEIARSLDSTQISRFRNLANKLMVDPMHEAELVNSIREINADVKAFESKKEKLSEWHIGTLLTEVASVPLANQLDSIYPYASPLAGWLFSNLEDRLPDKLKQQIDFSRNMLIGLATGSTIDSIIVSRTRSALSK